MNVSGSSVDLLAFIFQGCQQLLPGYSSKGDRMGSLLGRTFLLVERKGFYNELVGETQSPGEESLAG